MKAKDIVERQTALRQAILKAAPDGVNPDAESVVQAARNRNNPLHAEFDWNDTRAAHQHRLAVARALIRNIVYTVQDSTGSIISCVAYTHEPGNSKQKYIPVASGKKNKAVAVAILIAELDRVKSAVKRMRNIASVLEMDDIFNELDDSLVRCEITITNSVKPTNRKIQNSEIHTTA